MANKKPFRVRDRETKQLLDIYFPGQDVNVNTDGTFKALPEALGELQEEISEAGTGNYTKPPGGIPYSDLSQDVRDTLNEVADKVTQVPGKGLSTNDYTTEEKTKLAGLSNYNDAELRQRLTRLQTALDNLMNGESVTDAIDTFNEVTAFLNGIDTDDPKLFNQLKSLSDAITALQTTLSTKANSSDVANTYATKSELTSGLSGKQDTLTPGTGISLAQNGTISVDADNTPTPDSPKPVTSGGVSTALQALLSNIHIGTNGNWWVGPETDPNNDTGIKAQGPKGNSVVDGDTFHVINNLTEGGEGDALSAEMGKWLYTTLYTIFSQLGAYAFPNGKPQIDWGGGNPPVIPPCTVSKTIGTGLSSTGGDSDVAFGDPLEVSIAITNNLYVVDDDSVVVTMGGSPVQGAWNASTMKVTIAAVTGNVVINVPSLTYFGYGEQNSPLVSMFDGKSVDAANNQWIDKIDNTRVLQLSGCTVASDHVEFDGTNSKALASSTSVGVDVSRSQGTIEFVAKGMICNSTKTSITTVTNHRYTEGGSVVPLLMLSFMYSSAFGNGIGASFFQKDPNEQDANVLKAWLLGKSALSENDKIHLSLSDVRAYLNGTPLTRSTATTYSSVVENAKLGIFSYVNRTSGAEATNVQGSAYCVRMYNRQLTADEVLLNYKVDQKRFNL